MSTRTRYAFVVDDNRMIANQLVQMLKLLGFEAYAAYGALPAMQSLNQHVPDLILLDIHMQGVNGVEVCRYLRRDPRTAQVLILAISSDNQPELVNSMRAAGANGFLAKPIQLEALEAALRDLQPAAPPKP